MPLAYELLEILVNPNVAYLLLLIGLVGLAIELFSPGLIAPGTIGVISFLLGLYGTAQLPVTAAGVLLLVFGVAMIIAEAHLPDPRHPGRLRGGGADRRGPASSTTPTRAPSRSRPRS